MDRTRLAIVEASIAFGHALGLRVTAEGIETVGQRDRLSELRCDIGQGYLFGKAVPPVLARPLRQWSPTPSLRVVATDDQPRPIMGSASA